MDNTTRQLYDKLVYAGIANTITLSKKEKALKLLNFNPKNEAHLTVLYIALTAQVFVDFDIQLDMPLIQFIIFKVKNKDKHFKRIKNQENSIECDKFIEDIERPNNAIGMFSRIYNAYYKRKF